jgi:hypothetical protein
MPLIFDRKTCAFYNVESYEIKDGFVHAKNPTKKCRITRQKSVFKEGTTHIDSVTAEYGEKCYDFLLPSHSTVIEEMPQQIWATVSKEEAEKSVLDEETGAQILHDELKAQFLSKLGFWKMFLYKIGWY